MTKTLAAPTAPAVAATKPMDRYQPAEQVQDGRRILLIVDMYENTIGEDWWLDDVEGHAGRKVVMDHANAHARAVAAAAAAQPSKPSQPFPASSGPVRASVTPRRTRKHFAAFLRSEAGQDAVHTSGNSIESDYQLDDDAARVGRSFSGHYTVEEVRALLEDLEIVQAAWDAWTPRAMIREAMTAGDRNDAVICWNAATRDRTPGQPQHGAMATLTYGQCDLPYYV